MRRPPTAFLTTSLVGHNCKILLSPQGGCSAQPVQAPERHKSPRVRPSGLRTRGGGQDPGQ